MFHPNLVLSREPDGEFTLDAVTITPNSSYSAGRGHPGVPSNVRITPETFSVLLPIRTHIGPAAMVLTPVRHQLRNLDLKSKNTLLAFTTIGDRVVGSASIPVHAGCMLPKKDPVPIETSGWFAWANLMPGSQRSFHVIGTVLLPTPGYEAKLEVASPQGINPRDLILDLHLVKKPGIWPQHVTPVLVRYDRTPYDGGYQTVLVREPDGDVVQLDVEEAL
jgi:hypothetical protein